LRDEVTFGPSSFLPETIHSGLLDSQGTVARNGLVSIGLGNFQWLSKCLTFREVAKQNNRLIQVAARETQICLTVRVDERFMAALSKAFIGE
jgi:hypothetical protein